MGSHQSAAPRSVVWLTPPPIIEALGGWQSFDLDPCAAPAPQPWPTALRMNTAADADGLAIEWRDRVWLNPPYTSAEVARWLARLAEHDRGTALIFARTETAAFQRDVLGRASGLLFLAGRLHFHHPNGVPAGDNAGAPSVLCAYGPEDLDRLAAAELPGAFVPLRFARFAIVAGLDGPWPAIMREWLRRQHGPVSVGDAYRYFARHPKVRGRHHWQAQIRKQLARVGERVAPNQYAAA
jgi:hypothetical protein